MTTEIDLQKIWLTQFFLFNRLKKLTVVFRPNFEQIEKRFMNGEKLLALFIRNEIVGTH